MNTSDFGSGTTDVIVDGNTIVALPPVNFQWTNSGNGAGTLDNPAYGALPIRRDVQTASQVAAITDTLYPAGRYQRLGYSYTSPASAPSTS